MEGFRLNPLYSGIASVMLAWVPDVQKSLHLVNDWTAAALNVASLLSVVVILLLNLKKLRSNAAPSS